MTLEIIRLHLERGSPPDFLSQMPGAVDDAIARYPGLDEMLQVGSIGYRLKEDHTYHIDYPGLLATREVLLAFGRRLLAEGRIGRLEDVWMLTREELHRAVVDQNLITLKELVQQLRKEMARGREEGPRPYLGEAPPPVERHTVLEQFYGAGGAESSGAVLQGIAASAGEVEGVARVVAGPEDFRRVRSGDVLVTTTTTPAWTPLFASLAGLVTETGGVLSHAAVVAREYRLAAVVGVEGATQRIPDGARVHVDGIRGRVAVSGSR
jgi:pyruvate,water dikinase